MADTEQHAFPLLFQSSNTTAIFIEISGTFVIHSLIVRV